MKTLKVLAVLAVMGVGVLGANTTADACLAGGCRLTTIQRIPGENWGGCFLFIYRCIGQPVPCEEIVCNGH